MNVLELCASPRPERYCAIARRLAARPKYSDEEYGKAGLLESKFFLRTVFFHRFPFLVFFGRIFCSGDWILAYQFVALWFSKMPKILPAWRRLVFWTVSFGARTSILQNIVAKYRVFQSMIPVSGALQFYVRQWSEALKSAGDLAHQIR